MLSMIHTLRCWSLKTLHFTEQHLEIIKILLDHNAEVRTSDKYGMTPLQWVVNHLNDYEHRLKIMKLFLERDANVSAVNRKVFTPLLYVCFRKIEAVDMPLYYNADITAINQMEESSFRVSPLRIASSKSKNGLYSLGSLGQPLDLLWFQNSLRFKNEKGQNALHIACCEIQDGNGQLYGIIDWLVSKGVDLHGRDESGLTPILTAAQREIDTAFQALVPHINERSAFQGCLEAHLFGSLKQKLQVVETIFKHDPEPFGDIKNNVGVLSRYIVEKHFELDWAALVMLPLEQGLGLEDDMGIWEVLWAIVVRLDWRDCQGTAFEIIDWLAKKLMDENPGLLNLELCNAVMRLVEPLLNEGGDIDLNTNDIQSSQGNDLSECDRQKKNTKFDHNNKKRKRLEEEEEEDKSFDEEEGKDETGQDEDDSGSDQRKDTEVGHNRKKRKRLEAPSSDKEECNDETCRVDDDSESDRQEEDSDSSYIYEESPQSESLYSDHEEHINSTDQGNDDSELDWDETHIEASQPNRPPNSWASKVDYESIYRLKELRATLLHQIYG